MGKGKILLAAMAAVLALLALLPAAPKAYASDLESEPATTENSVMEASEPSDSVHQATPCAPIGFDSSDIVDVSVVTSVNPVTPSNATGLKKLLLQLIGNYDMVTSEYTYTSSNGYTSKQVTTESDYSWMFACGLFIIVLYSLFRFVGGIVCAKR